MTNPKDGCRCPKCGGKLEVEAVRTFATVIHRWEQCVVCEFKVRTAQPHKRIIAEVKPHNSARKNQPLQLGLACP